MRFEKISIEQGLSQSVVHFISQDSLGFVWISTQEGLNRFDGYKFKVFKNDIEDERSIPDNVVYVTFEDSSGNLWIGTENLGLAIYDREINRFNRIKLSDEKFNGNVTSIAEDSDGNIWVGTLGYGLFKIVNFEVSFHYTKNMSDICSINCNEINSLCYDKDSDKLFVGTWTGGLNILDRSNNKFSYYLSDENNPDSISDNRIKCIAKDRNNNIWITTHKSGINKFSGKDSKFIKYFHDSKNENSISGDILMHICEDRNGLIWIATRSQGLNSYDPVTDKFCRFSYDKQNPNSLSSNSILSLFVDNTNVLWIGTWGEGICKTDLQGKKFHQLSNNSIDESDEKSNKITSVHLDSRGNLWLGTFNDGIYRSNFEKKVFEPEKFKHVDKNNVYCIIEDSNKRIWFSTMLHGLFSYHIESESFEVHDHELYDFKEERIFQILNDKFNRNLLWVGTESFGLLLFDIVKNSFVELQVPESLRNISIYSLYQDGEGTLWIGTQGKGLFIYDTGKNVIKEISSGNFQSVSNDSIWCITEDRNNNIWLGTSNGLNKYSKSSDNFKRFTEKEGLINDIVSGILIDENDFLWLSTNNGLTKFNPSDEKFINYFSGDGLSGNEFNAFSYFKSKTGEMYFGGMNGVTYFHPDEIESNPCKPNIVITDFEIFNKPVLGSPDNAFLKKNISNADEINLTYKESVFSFRFSALIFNNSQKNEYAYKMEGFDKEWTYCHARRRVTYTNLNHGDYVFRVKGSNNDGVWNEEGTSIKIHISPPYWKTWWFKGLGALSLVAATGYSYRQRLEKLEKETKAQEEFSRKLIESQEKERKRIAHALHDTIAHEILISKNKALMSIRKDEDRDAMKKTLEEISELASSTITDVRNISYDLHPRKLETLGFTKTIRSIIKEVTNSTSIKFAFETDNIDGVLSKESEINLYRVLQETISNIIRHSKATEAKLTVSRLENYLQIVLTDNGKGFDIRSKEFAEARQSFGLSGIAERLKYMKGEVKIESEINKGTTLRFKIPVKV